ncbi:MAG: hypothetical protein LUB59_01850, partial [Candidatus Gastranaerophilales bacterium]|nr:hypothetical protein [Candidatus Gastranaerophilales bacterium]
ISDNKDLRAFFNENRFDLTAISDYDGEIPQDIIAGGNFINLHSSLLPSFPEKTAVKDAYLAGVKVTGVTVYNMNTGIILAQYPVLIDNFTHYDQLEDELNELGSKLFPIVIKSILDDRIFDIVEYLSMGNNHCCGRGKCIVH